MPVNSTLQERQERLRRIKAAKEGKSADSTDAGAIEVTSTSQVVESATLAEKTSTRTSRHQRKKRASARGVAPDRTMQQGETGQQDTREENACTASDASSAQNLGAGEQGLDADVGSEVTTDADEIPARSPAKSAEQLEPKQAPSPQDDLQTDASTKASPDAKSMLTPEHTEALMQLLRLDEAPAPKNKAQEKCRRILRERALAKLGRRDA